MNGEFPIILVMLLPCWALLTASRLCNALNFKTSFACCCCAAGRFCPDLHDFRGAWAAGTLEKSDLWTQSRANLEEAIEEEKENTDHNWDSDLLSHEQRLEQRLNTLKLDMFIMGSDGACQVFPLTLLHCVLLPCLASPRLASPCLALPMHINRCRSQMLSLKLPALTVTQIANSFKHLYILLQSFNIPETTQHECRALQSFRALPSLQVMMIQLLPVSRRALCSATHLDVLLCSGHAAA